MRLFNAALLPAAIVLVSHLELLQARALDGNEVDTLVGRLLRSDTAEATGDMDRVASTLVSHVEHLAMEAFPAETASLAAKKASGAAKKKYRSNKEAGNRADTIAQFEAQFGEAGKAVVAEWRGFWDKISKNYNVVKADDFLTNEKAYKFLVETTKTSNQKLGVPKRNDAIKFLEFQFGEEKVKNAIKEAVDRLRAEAKIRGTRVEKVPGYDHVSSVWRDYDIETRFLSDR